ncbi:MAG TPA: alpha/beta hydrolase-fold protein [Rudaea sp.]|jgi:predicted alpha/beta superfamily hydrolase
MRASRLLGLLLTLLLVFPALVHADSPFLAAKPDAIDSAVLKQRRQIEVYLPAESAKNTDGRYETLYVLDGDWNTHIVVDVISFMRQVGVAPPLIVVSVPNFFDEHGVNSRDHDLTPTVAAEQARSGGAADFLAFLKTELIPYVDAHYPSSRVRLIHGHSYGGLFLIYALLHEPTLFDGYLVLDPALRWDNHALDAALAAQLAGTPTKGKAIYIAGREGSAFEGMGIASANTIFEHRAPRDLHWKIVAYPGETHDSLKLKATYDALRYAYQGYTGDTIRLVPTGGTLIVGKPMFITIDGGGLDRVDLHYSTDGTVPTEASPKAEGPFAVSDPGKITVKLLSNRGVFDRLIPLNLRSGKAMPPARGARETPNWQIAYYAAEAWPGIRHARAFETATSDGRLDFGTVGRDAFAGTITRNIAIPADGYYVLGVATADKARASIGDKAIVEQDGSRGSPHEAFVEPLQHGVYPVRIDFLHATKGSQLQFIVFQVKDGEPEWWKNEIVKFTSTP